MDKLRAYLGQAFALVLLGMQFVMTRVVVHDSTEAFESLGWPSIQMVDIVKVCIIAAIL